MALAERNLGQALLRRGRFERARGYLDRALTHYGAVGQTEGQISTLNAIGYLASSVGDDDRSISIFTELTGRLTRQDERWAVASSNLAVALERAGKGSRAIQILQDVVTTAAAQGWPGREQWAWNNLAGLWAARGRTVESAEAAERALSLATASGDEVGRSYALANLAVARHGSGERTQAVQTADRALELARELQVPDLEASVLNHLGDFATACGEADRARAHYTEALTLAEEIGEASETRRARAGLQAARREA